MRLLDGARLGTLSESKSGDQLNADFLKATTGGDAQVVRGLRRGEQEVFLQTKLALATNHRPRINTNDPAIIERLQYIPFEARFVPNPTHDGEQLEDPELIDRLQTEKLNDVFAWLVQGAIRYLKEGLNNPPDGVLAAKNEYVYDEHDEPSPLDLYLRDHVDVTHDPKHRIKNSDFREQFVQWCAKRQHSPPPSISKLTRALKKRRIGAGHSGRTRYYSGVVIRRHHDDDDDDGNNNGDEKSSVPL